MSGSTRGFRQGKRDQLAGKPIRGVDDGMKYVKVSAATLALEGSLDIGKEATAGAISGCLTRSNLGSGRGHSRFSHNSLWLFCSFNR